MTDVQVLVAALQQALGLSIQKGQITLNIAGGLYMNAEYRICIGTAEDVPKMVDNTKHPRA